MTPIEWQSSLGGRAVQLRSVAVLASIPLRFSSMAAPLMDITAAMSLCRHLFGERPRTALLSPATLAAIVDCVDTIDTMRDAFPFIRHPTEFLAGHLGLNIAISDQPPGVIRLVTRVDASDAATEIVINGGPLPMQPLIAGMAMFGGR